MKLRTGLPTQISSENSSEVKKPIWVNIPMLVHPEISLAGIAAFLSLMPALCSI